MFGIVLVIRFRRSDPAGKRPREGCGRLAQVPQNDKPILLYTTCPSAAEAERIGGVLVDQGLAACVNILPTMTSIYIYDGARHRDSEAVMIVKTRGSLQGRVTEAILRLHPYETPAVLALTVEGGAAGFLAWILEQTATPR
jgi:periplasmic divalent cation tolerance protein